MHVFTVQGNSLSNSCLNICFSPAYFGQFHLDNYNLMRLALTPLGMHFIRFCYTDAQYTQR